MTPVTRSWLTTYALVAAALLISGILGFVAWRLSPWAAGSILAWSWLALVPLWRRVWRMD